MNPRRRIAPSAPPDIAEIAARQALAAGGRVIETPTAIPTFELDTKITGNFQLQWADSIDEIAPQLSIRAPNAAGDVVAPAGLGFVLTTGARLYYCLVDGQVDFLRGIINRASRDKISAQLDLILGADDSPVDGDQAEELRSAILDSLCGSLEADPTAESPEETAARELLAESGAAPEFVDEVIEEMRGSRETEGNDL